MLPYLPANLPFPSPSLDAFEFWRHCAERRLKFQTCAECGVARHPPTPLCPHCHSKLITWVEAPSIGRIFSYTIVHNASHETIGASLPYNVVLVEFDGLDSLRIVSNVIDAEPHELVIGQEVVLAWEEGPQGQLLPRFRLRRGE